MSFKNILIDLREIFELFEDPKDKFIQLMDMAKESNVLDVSDKIDKNKDSILSKNLLKSY